MLPRAPAQGGKRVNHEIASGRGQNREPCRPSAGKTPRLDRRRILSLLAALPTAIGLAICAEWDAAEARTRDDKTTKRRQHKQHGHKNDNGGGLAANRSITHRTRRSAPSSI